MVKVALIGATGKVGSTILTELVRRGHDVTAVARNAGSLQVHPQVTTVNADMTEPGRLANILAGHDAVISSATFTPGTSEGLINEVKASGVRRFLVVGGAGSLKLPSGITYVNEMQVPPDAMARICEGIAFLGYLRFEADLEWTFVSPSAQIGPGERTTVFRLGKDDLLRDEHGVSRISYGDYAIAMVDELETPAHIRSRFTVGY